MVLKLRNPQLKNGVWQVIETCKYCWVNEKLIGMHQVSGSMVEANRYSKIIYWHISLPIYCILVWFGSCPPPFQTGICWTFPVLRVCDRAKQGQKKGSLLDFVKVNHWDCAGVLAGPFRDLVEMRMWSPNNGKNGISFHPFGTRSLKLNLI